MTLAWCVLALFLSVADDPAPVKADEAQEIWPMRLREALDLGLRKCPSIRVTYAPGWWLPIGCFDGPPPEIDRRPVPKGATPSSIVVEPVGSHAAPPRIKAALTKIIRSVESEYWRLAVAHVALWAADRTVVHALDVIEVEEAFGDPDCPQDLDDFITVQRRLRQFENDLLDRTADVIAAERQLRSVIGLPESDNRRIIPITPPIEAPLVFAWGTRPDGIPTNPPSLLRLKRLYRLHEQDVSGALNEFDACPEALPWEEDEGSQDRWFLDRPPEMQHHGGYQCESPIDMLLFRLLLRRQSPNSPPSFDRAASRLRAVTSTTQTPNACEFPPKSKWKHSTPFGTRAEPPPLATSTPSNNTRMQLQSRAVNSPRTTSPFPP